MQDPPELLLDSYKTNLVLDIIRYRVDTYVCFLWCMIWS